LITRTTEDGIVWLDQGELWNALGDEEKTPHPDRLSALLRLVGVPFHDTECLYASAPVTMIRALGGIPVVMRNRMPFIADMSPEGFAFKARRGMGYAAMDTYLNPNDKDPEELYDVNVDVHGVPSVAHTVHIGFFVAGLSQKAELEFCAQRDLVHLSRLTSARTTAQDNPPFLVEDASMLDMYGKLRSLVRSDKGAGDVDREARNAAWPLAKCSILGITGSLKNILKMAQMADDRGKEAEVRAICRRIQYQTLALFPELGGPR
jgi:hypothetical protein